MGVSRIDSWPKFLVGSSEGLWMDNNGRIVLEPENFWPNQYGQDIDENGEPTAWDLSGIADPIVGYHVNLSKPGEPRRASMARQTTAPIPTNEGSWRGENAWIAGGRMQATDDRIPPTPEIGTAPTNTKGFAAGTYGYAIGYGSLFGDTTVSGVRYFDLANGEFPVIPSMEGFAPGITHLNIYLTTKNGGDDTLRLQRRIPVADLRGREIPIYGPRRNRGKPPASNKSGVDRPQKPPNRNTKTKSNSRGDTLAGRWRAAYQLYIPGMGATLVGTPGEFHRVKPDRKRVKVDTEEALVMADAHAINTTPPGRREETPYDYMGEEIDPSESAFLGALNGARAADGERNDLVLNATLNRAAWKHVNAGGRLADLAYDEGYREPALGTTSSADSPDALLDELIRYPGLRILDEWREIGVARGPRGWSIVLGDGEPEIAVTATFETVDADGNVYTCDPSVNTGHDQGGEGDVQFADATATMTWDCVVGNSLSYSYSGSYDSAMEHAAEQMRTTCGLTMESGGGVLDITDGALPTGVMGRTYSDGRMILSSSLMSAATENARQACTTHETGHAGRLAHDIGTTVMRTTITTNSNSNIDEYTSEDAAALTSLWGDPVPEGGEGGGGTQGETTPTEAHGTGGNEIKRSKEGDERENNNDKRKDRRSERKADREERENEEPAWHWEVRTDDYARKTVLVCRPPKMLKKGGRAVGMKYTAWWFHRDDEGNETSYVVRPKGPKVGAAAYFQGELKVAGFPGGEGEETEDFGAPKGRGGVELVAEDPPEEDETMIEAPDPTSAPDEPFIHGEEVLEPGKYVADVQGVTAEGAVTRRSDLARKDNTEPWVTTTLSTMPKVYLPQTVNLIKNAEGGTLDRNDKPEDWTIVATSPGYFRARDTGGFEFGSPVSTTTANLPKGTSRKIVMTDDTPFTIAGTLGVSRWASGGVRVRIREFLEGNDTTSADSARLVSSLDATGDMKFSKEYGPGGSAWPPGLAYILIDVEAYQASGSTFSVEGYVEHLRAFPYGDDIGKVTLEGLYGDFNPTPDVPAPSGSYIAVGLPPSPGSGAATPEPSAPAAYTGFEGSAPGAGWTAGGSITPTYPTPGIYQTRSIRWADTSTTVKQHGWVETSVANLIDKRAYFRGLYIFDTLPSAGRTRFHAQSDGSALTFAVNVDYLRRLVLEYTNANGKITTKILTTKINVGQKVDIETVVTPGKTGLLELYIGLGGATRARAAAIPWDLTNRGGHRCQSGLILHTDTKSKSVLRADQLVVTSRGDVQTREQPVAPVAYTPAPVDRPFDPARNLLYKAQSDAEATTTGVAAYWDAVISRDTTTYRTGATSWKTVIPAPDAHARHGLITQNTSVISSFVVAAGQRVIASAWVLAPLGVAFRISSRSTRSDGTALADGANPAAAGQAALGTNYVGTGDWQFVQTPAFMHREAGVEAPTQAYRPMMQITMEQAAGAQTFYADNLQIELDSGDGATYWQPGQTATAREFDEDDADIYQIRAFIEPGTTDDGPRRIPLLDEPMNVRPGVTYTFGAYSRSTAFSDDISELRIRLSGEGMPTITGAVIELTGEMSWASRSEQVTIPAGYTYANPILAAYEGFYVLQEFAYSPGVELLHGYGRATLGTGSFEIDALPDDPYFPRWISEVGAKELGDPAEVPGELVATIATTNDGITYLPYTDPVDKALRYYRVDINATGDGRYGPEISDLYARTWCAVGQVCDPEGAPINAYVGNLFTAAAYPDIEPRRSAGRSANVPDSDDVLQGTPVTIRAFDEEAKETVELLSRRATLQLNVPTAGGAAAGKSYEVRLEGGIKLVPEETQLAGIGRFGRREVVYTGTADVVDVIAEGVLPDVMSFIDEYFDPTLGEGGVPELIP